MSSAAANHGLAQLLSQAERRMTHRLERLLGDGGVSLGEWRVLSCLANGGGRPMNEVAEFAMLPPPTLTKVVDRMVAGNLVYRGIDVRDRRRVLVFLTPRGRALHRRLHRLVEDEQGELQESCDPEALSDLTRLLVRLIETLDHRTTPSRRSPSPRTTT